MTKIDWGKTLTSKAVWLGLLTVLAGIIEYLANVPPTASIGTIIVGCLTIVIRFLTKDPITK
jgi:ABC-type Mn2+/Zn2+ transport system permease subunit